MILEKNIHLSQQNDELIRRLMVVSRQTQVPGSGVDCCGLSMVVGERFWHTYQIDPESPDYPEETEY